MIHRLVLSLFLALSSSLAFGQNQNLTPEKLGYTSYSIEHKTLGSIHYYLRNPNHDTTKPLLLYLDGSGPYPLFQRMKQGYGSTVLIQNQETLSSYNLVLISKPGVPFVDDVEFDATTGAPSYAEPAEYTKRLSLDWRVDSARAVIGDLLDSQKLTPSRVVLIGVSEGFQVGAKLAALEPRITHVGLFVGNGLNQFYDFIVAARLKAERGETTAAQAQTEIENILADARSIYAEPESIDKRWMGHTYKRWASFTNSAPLEHLLKVKTPVFVACCSLDKNTSVLSADYIPLEFAKRGRKNLTYHVYPFEHSFMEFPRSPDGSLAQPKSHFDEVLAEFFTWVEKK